VWGQEIVPVPDGVIVQDLGQIQRESAVVNTYIQIPKGIESDIQRSYYLAFGTAANLISALEREDAVNRTFGEAVATILKWRLNSIKQEMVEGSRRSRRGLFDFVGKVSKSLFGTATAEDISNLQAGVDALGNQQTVIIENQNKLIGVVTEMSEDLQEHSRALNLIRGRTERLISRQDQIVAVISAITKASIAESIVSMLEAMSLEARRVRDRAVLRKLLCEGGAVTEDLISRSFLNELNGVLRFGRPLSQAWYYHNLQVDRYYETENEVVCVVNIPLVREEIYLSKKIYTYPVPRHGLTRRIYRDVWVAVGTLTGHLFYPLNCMGQSPTVCHAGMMFRVEQEKCVRGIISGEQTKKEECEVQVTTIGKPNSLVRTSNNDYVVNTEPTSIVYRCPAVAPSSQQLAAGLFIIRVGPGCLVEAENWQLEGVVYRDVNKTLTDKLTFPDFPHLSINWTTHLSKHLNITQQQQRIIAGKYDLPPTLQPIPKWKWHTQHTSVALYVTGSIIIVLVCAVTLYCCCCGCPKCTCCVKTWETPTVVTHYNKEHDNVSFVKDPEQHV